MTSGAVRKHKDKKDKKTREKKFKKKKFDISVHGEVRSIWPWLCLWMQLKVLKLFQTVTLDTCSEEQPRIHLDF